MRMVDLLDTLELQHHLVVNDEIRAESFIEPDPLILNGDGYLPLDTEPTPSEFMRQDGFVDSLQQARTEVSVD